MNNPNESATQEGQPDPDKLAMLIHRNQSEGQEKQVEDSEPDALFALHRTNTLLRERVEVMRQALERVRTVDFRTLIEKGDLNGFYKQIDEALDWMRAAAPPQAGHKPDCMCFVCELERANKPWKETKPNDLSTRTEAGGVQESDGAKEIICPHCGKNFDVVLRSPIYDELRSLREQVEAMRFTLEALQYACTPPNRNNPEAKSAWTGKIWCDYVKHLCDAALSPSSQKGTEE